MDHPSQKKTVSVRDLYDLFLEFSYELKDWLEDLHVVRGTEIGKVEKETVNVWCEFLRGFIREKNLSLEATSDELKALFASFFFGYLIGKRIIFVKCPFYVTHTDLCVITDETCDDPFNRGCKIAISVEEKVGEIGMKVLGKNVYKAYRNFSLAIKKAREVTIILENGKKIKLTGEQFRRLLSLKIQADSDFFRLIGDVILSQKLEEVSERMVT